MCSDLPDGIGRHDPVGTGCKILNAQTFFQEIQVTDNLPF